MLNVGFGLGLVDSAIQMHTPKSHTIIEAHPDVLQKVTQQLRLLLGGWHQLCLAAFCVSDSR